MRSILDVCWRWKASLVPATALALGAGACTVIGAPYVPPKVSIAAVSMEDCDIECHSIDITFTIENASHDLYCVPGEYERQAASESVQIFVEGQSEPLIQTTPFRHEAFVRSRDLESRKLYVRSHANLVIQPKSTRTWLVTMPESFSIPKEGGKLSFLFQFYPCDERVYQAKGFSSFEVESKIHAIGK